MNPEKIQAVVAILTRNSAASLERALHSVREFNEILVCDGGSTDATLQIAAKYGANVIKQRSEFLDKDGRLYDYGGARNQCLEESRSNWFFFLDSDEYCGDDLITAIRHVTSRESQGAYWIDRKYVRNGVVIDHATTYPNRQMRLFARSSAVHFIKKIHERILLKEGVRPRLLQGTLYVPLDEDLSVLREKWNQQIRVEAQRVGPLSVWKYIKTIYSFSRVSALYAMRYAYIVLFTRGTRLPAEFEWERHLVHLRLLKTFWPQVFFVRNKRHNV